MNIIFLDISENLVALPCETQNFKKCICSINSWWQSCQLHQ